MSPQTGIPAPAAATRTGDSGRKPGLVTTSAKRSSAPQFRLGGELVAERGHFVTGGGSGVGHGDASAEIVQRADDGPTGDPPPGDQNLRAGECGDLHGSQPPIAARYSL